MRYFKTVIYINDRIILSIERTILVKLLVGFILFRIKEYIGKIRLRTFIVLQK